MYGDKLVGGRSSENEFGNELCAQLTVQEHYVESLFSRRSAVTYR